MTNSAWGSLRLRGIGILASGAILALTHAASATPNVGPAFTLAEPDAADVRLSIAGNQVGYLVSWSAGGAVWAHRVLHNGAPAARPENVVEPDTEGPDETEYAGTRVVGNTWDYLVQYGFRRMGVPAGEVRPVLVETGFELKVIGQGSGIAPGRLPGIFGDGVFTKSGVTSGAEESFSLLELAVDPTAGLPPILGFRTGRRSAPEIDSATLLSRVRTTELVDMAWNGVTALATVRNETGASLVRFGEGTLTEMPGATAAKTMLVANHGDDFVLVSEASNGSLSFVVTAGDFPEPSSPSVIINALGTGPESLLAVEPADESCLVLSAAAGEGGAVLRMRRITYDGKVLDPEGVDVVAGSEGDLARSTGEHWLLATHEVVNGKQLIRGRFIGEGELPRPPAYLIDAGASSGPDAGVSTPGTGGQSSTGGAGGRPTSSGGRNASGGMAADASDGSGGSSGAGTSDDSGCAVKASRRDEGGAIALLIVTGAAGAARRRPRQRRAVLR